MRFSIAATVLLSANSLASAWVAPAFSTSAAQRSVSSRSLPTLQQSTIEMEMTSTASSSSSSSSSSLAPEYEAAFEMGKSKMASFLPEEYHSSMLPLVSHFLQEYMQCAQQAFAVGRVDGRPDLALTRFVTGVGYGLKYGTGPNKYQFDVSHKALRGKDPEAEDGNTIDFYEFGCDFFRGCMDFDKSVVLGLDNLKQADEQIKAGENVILFANHQSEADPQVVSCLLEQAGFKEEAEEMVYVAGHKVTTDPLAVPFSMGRNLICIHSKKHINSDAEQKPIKQRQNLKAMSGLLNTLKEGGAFIWVAPSGGRDRRNVETGEVPLAPFDSKTIDMFRLMGNKSKVKTHYYTLAMSTYDLCPPPDFVEAGVGEARNVRFVPVGIAVGKECESVGGLEKRKEFCKNAMAQCEEDYEKLLEAMK